MQDFNALEGKSLAELREIGRALGVGNVMLKKKELLEQIRAVTLVAGQHSDTEPNAVPAEEPKRRGRHSMFPMSDTMYHNMVFFQKANLIN